MYKLIKCDSNLEDLDSLFNCQPERHQKWDTSIAAQKFDVHQQQKDQTFYFDPKGPVPFYPSHSDKMYLSLVRIGYRKMSYFWLFQIMPSCYTPDRTDFYSQSNDYFNQQSCLQQDLGHQPTAQDFYQGYHPYIAISSHH